MWQTCQIADVTKFILAQFSSCSWGRSPREVVGPKVDRDCRQAQSYASPKDWRMMDRSPIARSWFHSITSLARPSSGSGTVRPSALAVLELMMSSTLVDCCTGNSAGFSPLSMRLV
jgi:hypothetical protein